MKTDKRTQLLKILSDASQSIPLQHLPICSAPVNGRCATTSKPSTRRARPLFTSSREGYRLESHTASLDTLPNEARIPRLEGAL